MSSNVIEFEMCAAPPGVAETVEAAVLEVSARISSLNAGKRRLYTRLEELRSGDVSIRRSRLRAPRLAPQRPVTFYSIEEATPAEPRSLARRA